MNVNITFGFMCFNTKDLSIEAFKALTAEAERLYPLVRRINLVLIDNGTDGTGKECVALLDSMRPYDHVRLVADGVNYGQGAARNQIVTSFPSDYILFMDGDICIVPGTSYPMLCHMAARPKLGCLSPNPHHYTKDPDKVQGLDYIVPMTEGIRSACTGYAMFRSEVFKKGIRFEDRGPFSGPGWGLEDDDMFLQLTSSGWDVLYFDGITYLQRKQRSSWPALKDAGVDVVKKFEERKEFFIEKWETKGIDPAILRNVKGHNLRGLGA